jgi:hypothetical protein
MWFGGECAYAIGDHLKQGIFPNDPPSLSGLGSDLSFPAMPVRLAADTIILRSQPKKIPNSFRGFTSLVARFSRAERSRMRFPLS